MCLKYQATENLRKSCYNWKRDEKSVQARLAIRPVLWKMVDTPTCIIGGMALLMALGRVSGADFLKMLGWAASCRLTARWKGGCGGFCPRAKPEGSGGIRVRDRASD